MDYRLRVIGKNIRKIREKNNYTIEYVAELAEINPAHLQRVETFKKGVSISCLYGNFIEELMQHAQALKKKYQI